MQAYCPNCQTEVAVATEYDQGFTCCQSCGLNLEEVHYSEDVQFQKGGDGDVQVTGQVVAEEGQLRIGNRGQGWNYRSGFQMSSYDRSNHRGRGRIQFLVEQLGIRPVDDTIAAASRLYALALQQGFTRGRTIDTVASACVYLIVRETNQPFLLMDFSDLLQVNVYALGQVFMDLAKLFKFDTSEIITKPIDPALYINRFADKLNFGKDLPRVTQTALKIIASMKRDWIQTGRRPAGVFSAALVIAAHMHGFDKITVQDVIRVSHIGSSTVNRRMSEFASTDRAALSTSTFYQSADAVLAEQSPAPSTLANNKQLEQPPVEDCCIHIKEDSASHIAHGMCPQCYVEYVRLCGGVQRTSADPPAFKAYIRKQQRELKGKKKRAVGAYDDDTDDEEQNAEYVDHERIGDAQQEIEGAPLLALENAPGKEVVVRCRDSSKGKEPYREPSTGEVSLMGGGETTNTHGGPAVTSTSAARGAFPAGSSLECYSQVRDLPPIEVAHAARAQSVIGRRNVTPARRRSRPEGSPIRWGRKQRRSLNRTYCGSDIATETAGGVGELDHDAVCDFQFGGHGAERVLYERGVSKDMGGCSQYAPDEGEGRRVPHRRRGSDAGDSDNTGNSSSDDECRLRLRVGDDVATPRTREQLVTPRARKGSREVDSPDENAGDRFSDRVSNRRGRESRARGVVSSVTPELQSTLAGRVPGSQRGGSNDVQLGDRETSKHGNDSAQGNEDEGDPNAMALVVHRGAAVGDTEQQNASQLVDGENTERALVVHRDHVQNNDNVGEDGNEENEDQDVLSDLEDEDVQELFCTPAEAAAREQVWMSIKDNQLYMERQKQKQAAQVALQERHQATGEGSTQGNGKTQKKRGPKPGTKHHAAKTAITPQESAQESLGMYLSNYKWGSQWSKDDLAELFGSESAAPQPGSLGAMMKKRKAARDADVAAQAAGSRAQGAASGSEVASIGGREGSYVSDGVRGAATSRLGTLQGGMFRRDMWSSRG